MPGRYLSDTTARCQTITQTRFFTTYVDSCWTVPSWPIWNPWVIRIGNATVTPVGTAIQAVLPDPSSMFYISRTAVPSAINHVSLLVESVSNPVVISVVETVDGQEVVLGEQLLQSAQMSTVSFSITPSTPSIRIRVRWFTAPAILRWRTICVQVPQMQSETYLVDVCDEIGDKYRFGFNGMHKDNEMQGIGNSLDFGARIYDSRVARFLSLDPLMSQFPSESNYIFAGNNPIYYIDLDGLIRYPKANAKEYTNEFPLLTLYMSEYLLNDIKKSTLLMRNMYKFADNRLLTTDNLLNDIINWDTKSNNVKSPEIRYVKYMPDNAYAYAPDNLSININWNFAKDIENTLRDPDVTKVLKYAALTSFFTVMVDEMTINASYYTGSSTINNNIRAKYPDGDPGDQVLLELFFSRNEISDGKSTRVIDSGLMEPTNSENGYAPTMETIKKVKKEGYAEILPTLPAKIK